MLTTNSTTNLEETSPGIPKWSGWVSITCAFTCFALVPTIFVHHVDVSGFYNPAGWGPLGIAAGLPLAAGMIVIGILMIRTPHSAG